MEIISCKDAKKKGLKRYFTGKPCKHGHISERFVASNACLKCREIQRNSPEWKLRVKKYQEDNRDKLKDYHKKYREVNKEAIKELKRNYCHENRESILQKKREYYYKNRDLIAEKRKHSNLSEEEKNKINQRMLNRYHNDPDYKVVVISRQLLRRVLKISQQDKKDRTNKALGYSSNDLKSHLESLFLTGMTWENYGDSWSIDHNYPVSRYIADGVKDPSVINSLSNLIPMWNEDNLNKKDRTLKEFCEDSMQARIKYGHFL